MSYNPSTDVFARPVALPGPENPLTRQREMMVHPGIGLNDTVALAVLPLMVQIADAAYGSGERASAVQFAVNRAFEVADEYCRQRDARLKMAMVSTVKDGGRA